MYDKNTADLIGTIVETPRYKKTENTKKSKIDFAMKIHRPSSPTSCDRIYVTAWEDVAEQIRDGFREGDRIEVKGKINVSSYKNGEQYHFFTRVIAEEVSTPSDTKGEGFGYIKVTEASEVEKIV